MSNTKYESQDESRKQLQLYDDLVKEYGKEFRCLSPKLHYTEENSQSALVTLIQMLTRLEGRS